MVVSKKGTGVSKKVILSYNIASTHWKKHLPDMRTLLKEAAECTVDKVMGHAHAVHRVEISLLLADDNEIQALNATYRHKHGPTNVLSFPALSLKAGEYDVLSGTVYLGDIALAFDTVQREAREQHKALAAHVMHLVVHGILHLLGYGHEEDKEAEKMEALEISILAKLHVKNPYA